MLPLTLTHRRLRLEWCRARGNRTAAEWNQVVFSDESRYNLTSDDNRVRVWRLRGERLNPAFALRRHTAPTTGVMVWGAIAYNTRSPLVMTRGTMTAQRFPIEPIWDHLRRRVGHPTSLNELEARLQQIWNEMSQAIIQNLYASMSDRIASCIRSRGDQQGIKSSELLTHETYLIKRLGLKVNSGVKKNTRSKSGFGSQAQICRRYQSGFGPPRTPAPPPPQCGGCEGVRYATASECPVKSGQKSYGSNPDYIFPSDI
ncbi:transposable element Tcb2 transposase [Trichonephila clavipes]|nr:transposable element Tcb2 transposase [Trichonephila clavipes]